MKVGQHGTDGKLALARISAGCDRNPSTAEEAGLEVQQIELQMAILVRPPACIGRELVWRARGGTAMAPGDDDPMAPELCPRRPREAAIIKRLSRFNPRLTRTKKGAGRT